MKLIITDKLKVKKHNEQKLISDNIKKLNNGNRPQEIEKNSVDRKLETSVKQLEKNSLCEEPILTNRTWKTVSNLYESNEYI
mgnify:CR=1 FL=1